MHHRRIYRCPVTLQYASTLLLLTTLRAVNVLVALEGIAILFISFPQYLLRHPRYQLYLNHGLIIKLKKRCFKFLAVDPCAVTYNWMLPFIYNDVLLVIKSTCR